MTVSGLIALLVDCLSAIVVNYCILYAQSTFILLICLMTGAVVHRWNMISASSGFSQSSFTWSSESSVVCPPWSLHSSIIIVFPALFLFSSSFLAEQVSSLIHGSPYIDKRSAWRPPSCQTCTAERPFPFRHTVFFDQSLEEWINKKSIHRSDVLLPVAFKGHRPSTNHNFIVQLCESAFRVGICYWSRHHFTRPARHSSLSSCSRVHPLQSRLSNSEWQW